MGKKKASQQLWMKLDHWDKPPTKWCKAELAHLEPTASALTFAALCFLVSPLNVGTKQPNRTHPFELCPHVDMLVLPGHHKTRTLVEPPTKIVFLVIGLGRSFGYARKYGDPTNGSCPVGFPLNQAEKLSFPVGVLPWSGSSRGNRTESHTNWVCLFLKVPLLGLVKR